jgi:hypothetical protein
MGYELKQHPSRIAINTYTGDVVGRITTNDGRDVEWILIITGDRTNFPMIVMS